MMQQHNYRERGSKACYAKDIICVSTYLLLQIIDGFSLLYFLPCQMALLFLSKLLYLHKPRTDVMWEVTCCF